MNGKFEQKYGLAWKDMDHDARMLAIMSEIFDLREDMQPLRDLCKRVDRHEIYWKICVFVISPIFITTIGWIIAQVLK